MRLADFPRKAGVETAFLARVSVEARCCGQAFSRRRTVLMGRFRMVRCPTCTRRAWITDAITDKDWSRACGDTARQREAPAKRERKARKEVA